VSFTAAYSDKILTVSPASFIDAEELIIEVSGSKGKSSTAGQGNNNERVDMDNGGEKEDRVVLRQLQ
jgi:hypothetical protein